MKRILEKFKNENKMVTIYNDLSDTSKCWTGFISEIDDEYVLLVQITEHGVYDGVTLLVLDEIINIEEGSMYEKKVQRLYELRNQKYNKLSIEAMDDLLEGMLNYAKEKEKFITITLTEDDDYPIIGIIEDIEDDYICIKAFKSNCEDNGFAYVKQEDIYQVFMDSLVEQDYALLYKNVE